MALEPQIKEIQTRYTTKIGEEKTQTAISLTSSTGEKLVKVLSVKGLPCVESVVQNAGSVVAEGHVCVQALALSEEGEILAITGQANFSTSFNSSSLTAETKVIVTAKNLGVENIGLTDSGISLVSLIGVEYVMLVPQSIKFVQNAAPANQKFGVVKCSDITSAVSETFELTTEIDSPSSASKILLTESYGVLTGTSVSTDLITLKGEVVTNLVYLTSDEKPKLKSQSYTTDFNQEILATGVSAGQEVRASLYTSCNNFEVHGELNSSKGVVVLKNKFRANAYVLAEREFETVVDAFCPDNEIKMKLESFNNQTLVCQKFASEKVDGNIVLAQDTARIDRVLATSSAFVLPGTVTAADETVTATGTVLANVVYLLDDEEQTLQSIQAEIPFEINVKCDGLLDGDQVSANVVVKELEARNKKAKEIDILADLNIQVTATREREDVVVSGVTLGEPVKSRGAAMGVYVVSEANELWDIAKALSVNPDMLLLQNPDLIFPIAKPTQVVVYRQKILKG